MINRALTILKIVRVFRINDIYKHFLSVKDKSQLERGIIRDAN